MDRDTFFCLNADSCARKFFPFNENSTMKIARLLLSDSSECYASVQPDGSYNQLDGCLFEGLSETGKTVTGKLLAPLVPVDILCIGLNYRKHAAEGGSAPPENPILFMKTVSTLQNPGDPIVLPTKLKSNKVDYECELAVIIGKRCLNVSRADALDYVLGYTAANDVSARDWQRNGGGGQWCRGKTFNTFCPLGPHLITADEIPNPNSLSIKTILNGKTMQDWNTDDMIFDVPTLIEFLSASTVLLPGTVILTGTPHGVGFAQDPPVFLKQGDSVTIKIENIGSLTNPVVDEVLS